MSHERRVLHLDDMAKAIEEAYRDSSVIDSDPDKAVDKLREVAEFKLKSMGRIIVTVETIGKGSDGTFIDESRREENGLLKRAFSDAKQTLLLPDYSRLDLPEGVSLNEILKNSKPSLLTAALLTEDDEFLLLMCAAAPDSDTTRYNISDDPSLKDSLIELVQTRDGSWRFAWKSPVQTYIRERAKNNYKIGRGCPAMFHDAADPDSQSPNLLYDCWDKLVDLAYPIS